MSELHYLEIVIFMLVVALGITAAARRILVPYPILLVIGGLILGAIPGVPVIRLDPELVFLVFLPPILWGAAYFTSWRDFRMNLRPIMLLAVGLVLATTAAVAAIAHALLPGLGWAAAIVLGAIVSPPDAVAATAIGHRLRLPHRVVTILEGESLVNDATALVVYQAAIAAAVSGTFVPSDTLLHFVIAPLGGVLIGIAIAEATRWGMCFTNETSTDIGVTLLAPYVAWILAELVHASGVLACVAGGLYLRRHFSRIAPATRIQARTIWEFVIFMLNGVLFLLIGLQLGSFRDGLTAQGTGHLVWYGAIVSAAVIAIRLVWVPLAAAIPRWLSPALRRRDPMPAGSVLFIIGWTGMRGIVSLAAALALPLVTASGAPFPFREQIVLLTFAVILSTLVLQGLSVPPLVRLLKVRDDGTRERETAHAREQAARAGLSRLAELEGDGRWRPEHIERLRTQYEQRAKRFAHAGPDDPDCSAKMADVYRTLRQETLAAERRAVIALRDDEIISDAVLHELEHELDVEALRIGAANVRTAER